MEVFQVWDHDSMASAMGEDYIADTYANRSDAEAEVERRNELSRQHWIANAYDGEARLKETWNWKHARLVVVTLK